MADSSKLWITFGVNTGGLDDANHALRRWEREQKSRVARMTKNMERYGRQMKQTGRMMTTYLTLPLAAVGAAAIKMHMDFEASMAKVVGLVGVAEKTVSKWAESVKKLAPSVGRSPKELGDALYFITSAGIRSAESMEVLEYSAKASAAGLGETKLVADLVTSAMNAYGKENLTAAMATDILVETVREGKSEATLLATTMGMVLPIAAELGVTFNQVGAGMAAMTRTGTTSATAAMQLRQILNSILKPAKQAEQALWAMGTSSAALRKTIREDGLLQALMDIRGLTNRYGEEIMATVFPNIRALSGVLDIMGKNLSNNIRIFENLDNATGRLGKAFGAAAKTTKFKLAQAMQELNRGMTELGESMKTYVVPLFELFGKKAKQLTDWYIGLNVNQQKLILTLGMIVVAMGPLITVFGFFIANIIPLFWVGITAIIAVLGKLLILIAANPLMAAAAIIGVLITKYVILGTAASRAANKQAKLNKEMAAAAKLAKQAEQVRYKQILRDLDILIRKEEQVFATRPTIKPQLDLSGLHKFLATGKGGILDQFFGKQVEALEIEINTSGFRKQMEKLSDIWDVFVLRIATGVKISPTEMAELKLPYKINIIEGIDESALDDLQAKLSRAPLEYLKNLKAQTDIYIKDMGASLATFQFEEKEGGTAFGNLYDEQDIENFRDLEKYLPIIKKVNAEVTKQLEDAELAAAKFKKDWEGDRTKGADLLGISGAVRQFSTDMDNINDMLSLNMREFKGAEAQADAYKTVIEALVASGAMRDPGFNLAKFIGDNTDLPTTEIADFVKEYNKLMDAAEREESLLEAADAMKEFKDSMKFLETKKEWFPEFNIYDDQLELLKGMVDELLELEATGKIDWEGRLNLLDLTEQLKDLEGGTGFVTNVIKELEKELKLVDTYVEATKDAMGGATRSASLMEAATMKLAEKLGIEHEEVQKLIVSWLQYIDVISDATKAKNERTSSIKNIEFVSETFKDVATSKGFGSTKRMLDELGITFDVHEEKMKIYRRELNELMKMKPSDAVRDAMIEVMNLMFDLGKSPEQLKDEFLNNFSIILSAAGNFANAMASLIEMQKQRELSAVGQNAKKREQIEKAYFLKQKKWAITQAIISGALGVVRAFEMGPVAGVIFAALVAATTAIQIATIQGQSFAQGAIVYGETYARVGEYAGARNNPEIIAPLDKLVGILRAELWGGMQSIAPRMEVAGYDHKFVARERKPQKVTFTIAGSELVGVLENYGDEYNNM